MEMQLGNYRIIVSYLDVTMRVSTEEEKKVQLKMSRGGGEHYSCLPCPDFPSFFRFFFFPVLLSRFCFFSNKIATWVVSDRVPPARFVNQTSLNSFSLFIMSHS